jgi:hypothetical protein
MPRQVPAALVGACIIAGPKGQHAAYGDTLVLGDAARAASVYRV